MRGNQTLGSVEPAGGGVAGARHDWGPGDLAIARI